MKKIFSRLSIKNLFKNVLKGRPEEIFITIFLLALIVLAVIKIVNVVHNNDSVEQFQVEQFQTEQFQVNNNLQNLDYQIAKYEIFPETIYERSLKETFPNVPRLYCNLNPTLPKEQCLDQSKSEFLRDRIPVHIIMDNYGKYYAVFNNGKIYSKDSLKERFWKGPLKNSYISKIVPLRMISLSPDGKKLMGVGYDNKLYIKEKEDYNSEWKLVPSKNPSPNDDIIYVMYDNDTRLIGINTEGFIVKKKTVDIDSPFIPIESEEKKLLKIFRDRNGYLLGLGTDFQLYKKKSKNWIEDSEWDNVKGSNPIPVNDVVYDNDGRMFGLVFLPVIGTLELMKQTQAYYLSEFVPLDPFNVNNSINNSNNNDTDVDVMIMHDVDILRSKIGRDFIAIDDEEDEYSTDSLNALHQAQLIADRNKLIKFCKEQSDGRKYSNFEIQNVINNQDKKINRLNTEINRMIEMEPLLNQ